MTTAHANRCAELIEFRDGELYQQILVAEGGFKPHKINLLEEQVKDTKAILADLQNDRPWVGASGAVALKVVNLIATRFIDLTSSLVPGVGTKALGLGYSSINDAISGKGIELIVIGSVLGEKMGPVYAVAKSTGDLIVDLKAMTDLNQLAIDTSNDIENAINSINEQVTIFEAEVQKLKEGSHRFGYLYSVKNYIDSECAS